MIKDVIIFGINDFAELAYYYFSNDSDYNVIAFTVTSEYIENKTSFNNLPVVSAEKLELIYPPESFLLFVPMAPTKMNRVREKIYLEFKEKGYSFASYLSSKAVILTKDIGENCFILESNVIQPFVKIGNNVILWSGNHIGHHSLIKDHVMFSSHVVLSGHCIVENNCYFGVNSTIKEYTRLKIGTFLAMSSGLTKDTEEWAFYKGFPATKSKVSTKLL